MTAAPSEGSGEVLRVFRHQHHEKFLSSFAVHNRVLGLEVSRRLDHGDDAFEWRIRPFGARDD